MEQTNLFRSSKNTSKPVPDIFLDLSVKIRNSPVLSFSWGVFLPRTVVYCTSCRRRIARGFVSVAACMSGSLPMAI